MPKDGDEEQLRELTELYQVVKEIIIYCEEVDGNMIGMPILNELRNSFDHLMRVNALHFGLKSTEEEDYKTDNMKKAYGHLYRAGYDALDWVCLTLRGRIVGEVQDFSLETINAVFPEYYKDIRPELVDIETKIGKIRQEKDVGEKNLSNFASYVNIMKTLKGHYKLALKKKPGMIEYEQKKEKEKKKDRRREITTEIIIGIILALIAGAIGYYLGAR